MQQSPPPGPRSTATRVLMVEDSPGHARLVRSALERSDEATFEVEHELRLDRALRRFEERDFDAMLLDLSLPDGYGVSTLGSACALANHLPVLVLTSTDDEQLALTALRAGAQEYLVKDRTDYRVLPATILRAIERHRRALRYLASGTGRAAVRPVPMRDPLTGLVNEALLWDRLAHALERAERYHGPLFVLRLGFDGLSRLREVAGDEFADALLCEAAARLAALAPRGDTLARFGPEGFAWVTEDPAGVADTQRLLSALFDAQAQLRLQRPLLDVAAVVPSAGVAAFPADGVGVEALLDAAERARAASLASALAGRTGGGSLH